MTGIFYIISTEKEKVLRCEEIEHEEFDYGVNLFVLDEGKVYHSEWQSLTKNDVTTFLESGWDVSKENPLESKVLTS